MIKEYYFTVLDWNTIIFGNYNYEKKIYFLLFSLT